MKLKGFPALVIALTVFLSGGLRLYAGGEDVAFTAAGEKTTAKAAVLMELSTGQTLYEKNAHEKLPVGTLNKIMTALITAEEISSGNITLQKEFSASEKAHSANGAVIWLSAGEKMTVENLLKALLIGNANDAAITLAENIGNSEEAFVRRMNERAKELGMSGAVFKNASGYDEKNQGCSAYEIAVLCREILKYDFLTPIMTCWMTDLRGGATQLVNANRLVRTYDGIKGIKASFSEASGYSLASAAERNGTTYISVVLGCQDKDSSFEEGKGLLGLGFSAYEVVTPAVPPEIFKGIRVKHGTSPEVGLRAEGLSSVVVKKGDFASVRTEVMLPKYLEAPVMKGGKIGEVSFYYGDSLIYRARLTALSAVERLSFGKALCKLLKSVFDFS